MNQQELYGGWSLYKKGYGNGKVGTNLPIRESNTELAAYRFIR